VGVRRDPRSPEARGRALQKRVEELELDLCRAVQWKEDLLNTCDEKDEIIRQYEGEFDGLGKRVEELESTLRFMSGLLSTYGHWAGMHPQEVMDEVLKMSAEMGMKLERPRMGGEG